MNEQNLTKKERRELRHTAESDRYRREHQKQFAKKILFWTGGIVFVIGVVYGIAQLANIAKKERPGQAFVIQGREHIPVNANHPGYNSNPPTSGWHYEESAAWGIYSRELPDEQLIHNLEHGGIWISYKDINPETKTKLETFANKYPRSVVLTPRSKNTAPITLASWGRLQELTEYDEGAIVAFIKANKNKSPEALAH